MLSYYGNSSSKLNHSFTYSMTQHIEVSFTSLTCKHTNFGGHDYSFFGDIATFNFRQFSLRTMVANKFNQSESVKKFMQVEVDITCMLTKFNGHGLSSFGDIATSNFAKFFFWTMDYIHGMSRIVTYCHVLSHYCHVLLRIVMCCHILSHIVTYCRILSRIVTYCRVLLRIVTYCHVLSRIITYCHILSRIVTYCRILSHIVTYCHVLLRIVTYCHVLSRIVTYCCVLSRTIVAYCYVLSRIVTYCHILLHVLSRIVTCIVTYCYVLLLRPCTHTHAFSYLY